MMSSLCQAHSSAPPPAEEYGPFLTPLPDVNCVAPGPHKVKSRSNFLHPFVAGSDRLTQDQPP
jgi:hypothetical protein